MILNLMSMGEDGDNAQVFRERRKLRAPRFSRCSDWLDNSLTLLCTSYGSPDQSKTYLEADTGRPAQLDLTTVYSTLYTYNSEVVVTRHFKTTHDHLR